MNDFSLLFIKSTNNNEFLTPVKNFLPERGFSLAFSGEYATILMIKLVYKESVVCMLRRFTRSIRYKFAAVPVRYWHFSGVEFTFWFATACAGFLTSYLQGQGMSSTQVGIITAANSAVAVVASPFWGMLSDKIRSIRTCLTVCIIIGGITWVCIPLVGNWVIAGTSFSMFFIPFSNFFRNPISMLKDSWVVGSANVQHLNYGAIRLWGSISYAIMSMILSLITPYIGMEWTFYLYGVTLIPLLLLCVIIKDEEEDSGAQGRKHYKLREMHFGRLFRNYYFVTFIIFHIAVNVPVGTAVNFLPYLMTEIQVDTSQIGTLMGYKALLEIPMLYMMIRFRRRFSLPQLQLAAATLMGLMCVGYGFSHNFLALMAASTIYGLAGGVDIGTATNYIYTLAPVELKATAQTMYGSVSGLAYIGGSLAGGILIDMMGTRAFFFLAAGITLAALLFLIGSIAFGKYVLHKEIPRAAMRTHS